MLLNFVARENCIGFGTVPVVDSTQSSKVIRIKCSHFSGFHGFNNRQRLHREYLFFKIFLVCPFHPCFVLVKILALPWLAWLFVHNNQQWFAHLEPWAFMWNFLSCFKVLLSFCQVVPSSPPSPMLQKISSQSNNSPDKFNIAPNHQHCYSEIFDVNINVFALFVLFAVWYWKWRRQGKGISIFLSYPRDEQTSSGKKKW